MEEAGVVLQCRLSFFRSLFKGGKEGRFKRQQFKDGGPGGGTVALPAAHWEWGWTLS